MLYTSLVVTTVLVGLVTGLLFGFAVVTMPGLKTLPDREFLRSFQVMDRIIQDNQPLFMVAWLGSVLGVVVSAVIGFGQLEGIDLAVLIAAAVIYLVGVQLPTAAINIPLNDRVQLVDVISATESELRKERNAFEGKWNRWNEMRSALATTALVLLTVLLVRI